MFAKQDLNFEPIDLPDSVATDDASMLSQAQEFLAQMQQRHSVRDFCDRSVPQEVIEACVQAAGTAPSGANHQPWMFVAISNPDIKHQIRLEAEVEEKRFYEGGASDEWLKALEPIGTGIEKPHLDIAPWLIVVFAQRWGEFADGSKFKNYYVPESVGIATGVLITALHRAGLTALTHTPNPMKFLNGLLGRPASEKATMIIAVGHPADDAKIPAVAKMKKPLDEILVTFADTENQTS